MGISTGPRPHPERDRGWTFVNRTDELAAAGELGEGRREKLLLERAAGASHLTVSSFVLQAASTHAEEVLANRQVIHLGAEAAAAFSKALEQPAQVNERLAASLGARRAFTWID